MGSSKQSKRSFLKKIRYILLLHLLCSNTLFSQQLCYIARGNEVLKLDINACSAELVGTTTSALTDIALTPSGNLYGIDFYNFYKVDTTNGALTFISSINAFSTGFNSLVGFNEDYVLAVKNTSGLYKIHTSTGDTTLIGLLGYYPAGDITYYKGSYYMADIMNRLIRFKLDFPNSIISDIEIAGTMNTVDNAVYGIVTMGEVTCEKDDLQMIAFEGTTVYRVNPANANCSTICPATSNLGASGAASLVETQTQFPDSRIEVPNIFTPNNDGVNDYFEPRILVRISNLHIAIFNRWGNTVYEVDSNTAFRWNGCNSANELCPDGVYFYKLIYADYCNRQEIVTGFIQLIR
nr:gliding motility-associated C-terminal domain-containing protein [uncultured Fluviicola sp.]